MRTLSPAKPAAPTHGVHPALTCSRLGSPLLLEKAVKALILTSLLCLTACARNDAPQAAPTEAFRRDGVTFELKPQSSDTCKARGQAYRGTVRWQVPADKKIDLELRLRAQDGQVFLGTNKAEGSQETGDWVEPGLWFLLLDHRKGEVVAAFQAGPSPCQ